jgi:phosphoglucosamine mutase
MSNWGLEEALSLRGIRLVRAAVGDRYVVEEMDRLGVLLGGEQSGHLIRADLTTTGDGTLTGLHVAASVAATRVPLATGPRLVRAPQVLLNVKVRERIPFESIPGFSHLMAGAEERIAGSGRILVRYSGTELLARVMVEGVEPGTVESIAGELAGALRRAVGVPA